MLVQRLGTYIHFLCQRMGISSFEVIGSELRIVGTCHIQQGLATLHGLPGDDRNAT